MSPTVEARADDGRPRECDLVLKGGITSGIVYPSAIAALAARFTLRNIGGASAGAIAAAVAAAAEHRRRREPASDPFAEVRGLAAELAEGQNLQLLFTPQRRTAPAWNILRPLLLSERWSRKLAGVFFGVLGSAGALFLALTAVVLYLSHAGALVWALTLAFVFTAVTALQIARAWRSLEANELGLCTGMPDAGPRAVAAMTDAERRVLIPWLHLKIQRIAGLALDRPLTFGDLWGAPDALTDPVELAAHHDAQWNGQTPRAITLELLTTDLTTGRPQRVPFDDELFVRPADLRRLFPAEVADWIVARGAPCPADPALIQLPAPWDLPVVFAVRLSLSFPLLFSVVPLYRQTPGEMRRCWFSDGGILSNFPIHLFDQMLPDRPTFGINLRHDFGPAEPDEARVVFASPGDGVELYDPFGRDRPRLVDFALAMLRALQVWQDHSQMQLPGFSDRIVHLRLRPSEGGLNLSMPPALIAQLGRLGTRAGEALCARFAVERSADPATGEPTETAWDAQRRMRFRCAAAMLGRVASKMNLVADD
ncbi:MAG: hypothetical protein JWM10_2232 [Myxococcaceae bacterium]|nr:hypothetical protein [Myxococcaceae bacterium]